MSSHFVFINTTHHPLVVNLNEIITIEPSSKDLQNFFRSTEKFNHGPIINGLKTYIDMMYVFEPKPFTPEIQAEIDEKCAGNMNVLLLVSTITLDSIKNAVKYYEYSNVNSLSNILSSNLNIKFAVVYSGTDSDSDGPICVRDGTKILYSRRLIMLSEV